MINDDTLDLSDGILDISETNEPERELIFGESEEKEVDDVIDCGDESKAAENACQDLQNRIIPKCIPEGLTPNEYYSNKKYHPPAPIYKWKPKPEDILVDYDGKKCTIHFEKLFNPKTREVNGFLFIKDAFKNQLDLICYYLNYFIYKYDEENEFMTSYLNLRYSIEARDASIYFGADDVNSFILYIYDILFTPSIVAKVKQMVEDNYLDDIEREDGGKRYAAKEKHHLESLEFTNEQVKIMLAISMGMKMISPIMFQFMATNNIKAEKKSNILYKFFHPLFIIFTPDHIDVYNKIFVFVKKKVLESKSNNEKIFQMREILGVDEYSIISMFVKNVVLSDNFVKLKFSKDWNESTKKYSENATGFLKTVIKIQFSFFLKIQHVKTFTELTSTKNADGLSGVDKLEMSSNKIDEGITIIEDESTRDALERLRKNYNFGITEDEIDFYMKNWKISPLQQELIYTNFAPIVGCYRACYSFSRREIIELAIMLRNRLLIESGFENYRDFTDKVVFPYIITANIDGKVNTRVIRNANFSEECENSYIIKELVQDKYKLLEEIDPNSIMILLSKLNNTVFTYCVYENPELLGEPINVSRENITDSAGYFLRTI